MVKITSETEHKYYVDTLISSKATCSTVWIIDTVHFDFWQNASNRKQSKNAAQVLVTTVIGSIHKLKLTSLPPLAYSITRYNVFSVSITSNNFTATSNKSHTVIWWHNTTKDTNLFIGLQFSKLIRRHVNDRCGIFIIDPLYTHNRQIYCQTFSSVHCWSNYNQIPYCAWSRMLSSTQSTTHTVFRQTKPDYLYWYIVVTYFLFLFTTEHPIMVIVTFTSCLFHCMHPLEVWKSDPLFTKTTLDCLSYCIARNKTSMLLISAFRSRIRQKYAMFVPVYIRNKLTVRYI